MDKEKVTELILGIKGFYRSINAIQFTLEWLEQNQPEPVVVGLSDAQVRDFGQHRYGDGTECDCFINDFTRWQREQEFVKPTIEELNDLKEELNDLKKCNYELNNALEVCIKIKDAKIDELKQLKSQLTPSWDDTPERAQWLAMTKEGSWFWFSEKPKLNLEYGRFDKTSGSWDFAGKFIKDWQQTLQQRPESHRKPKMINVNGFEVEDGDTSICQSEFYYRVAIQFSKLYSDGAYINSEADKNSVERGLAYRTKEGAIARAKAMLGIDPNAE